MIEFDPNRPILEDLGVIDPQPSVEPVQQKVENKQKRGDTATQEELFVNLKRIKARLDKLRAVFSMTLSPEISRELDRWQARAHELANALLDKDPAVLYEIISDDVDFYLTPPRQEEKPRIPLATQKLAELSWEVRQQLTPPAPKRDQPIHFGPGEFL
jgi:hypothetical protein